MKKILAVILTIVMLLGIAVFNTSADTQLTNTAMPTATLVTNDGSPLDIGTALDDGKFLTQDGRQFYFTLRFDNFIPIQGIDVEIKVETGEAAAVADETNSEIITSVETFNLPSAVWGRDEFDENYVFLGGNKYGIRFVDINITSKSRVVLGVNSPSATATVTATGKYADTGETLFKITTKSQSYDIVEKRVVKDVADETPKADPGYFIPYGGVYNEVDKTFSTKNADGTFDNIPSGSKYVQFKLPKYIQDANKEQINKLTPFGAATQLDAYTPNNTPTHDNFKGDGTGGSWRFGSYSEYDDLKNVETETGVTKMQHGTMMFVGDWLSLKEYYIKQGNTVQQFVKAIYEEMTKLEKSGDLDINVVDEFTTHHVSYQVPNRRYSEATKDTEDQYVWIDVYKYPRKHYIWRDFGAEYDSDGKTVTKYGKLEYAIRLHNMQPNRTYTAVAYCLEKDKNYEEAEISHNVKSIHLNSNRELGTNFEQDGYGNTNPETES